MADTSSPTLVGHKGAEKPSPSKSNRPDVMNDPAFDTNTAKVKHDSSREKDTCRICRSEATDAEPLYYPCKCSGSIKFVHQECLMEWLSHSQKKHCELCKTPFRFTKLYDPHMPATLPTPLFFKYLISHSISSLITWSRLFLVCFVWLAWLPWSMRSIWRFFFWMADGGWVSWDRTGNQFVAKALSESSASQLVSTATSLASSSLPLEASPLSDPAQNRSQLVQALSGFPVALSTGLNATIGEPIIWRLLKKAASASTFRQAAANQSSGIPSVTAIKIGAQSHPSILGRVTFLNTLTRSKTLNKVLIDTIEGQIITLLVVVAFILIFLIREWVVQQHPGLHAAGGQNAGNVGPNPDPQAAREQAPPNAGEAQGERARRPRRDDADRPRRRRRRQNQGAEENREERIANPADSPPPAARRRLVRRRSSTALPTNGLHWSEEPDEDDENQTATAVAEPVATFPLDSSSQAQASTDAESSTAQRPLLPPRESLSKATEIRRSIEEDGKAEKHQWPGLKIFMDYWNRAEGSPERVLKLIKEEGREEEFGWIVEAMNRLQDSGSQNLPTNLHLTVPSVRYSGPSNDNDSGPEGRSPDRSVEDSVVSSSTAGKTIPQKDPHSPDDQTARKGKARDSSPSTLAGSDVADGAFEEVDRLLENVASGYRDGRLASGATAGPSNNYTDILHRETPPLTVSPPGSDGQNTAGEQFHPRDDAEIRPREPASPAVENNAPPPPDEGTGPQIAEEAPPARGGFAERAAAWIWGGPDAEDEGDHNMIGGDDRRIIEDINREAPFVPVGNERNQFPLPLLPARNNQDAEGDQARGDAPQAGPEGGEAIDDGEDFEGIMELIGMQGPIAGLVQNALFSAVIISATVGTGVWFPYIWGKLVLLVAANPIPVFIGLPLRWASIFADVFVDLSLFVGGSSYYWADRFVRSFLYPLLFSPSRFGTEFSGTFVAKQSRSIAKGALSRLGRQAGGVNLDFSGYDLPLFSILSHEALHTIESKVASVGSIVQQYAVSLFRAALDPQNRTLPVLWKVMFWPFDSLESARGLISSIVNGTSLLVSFIGSLRWRVRIENTSDILTVDPNLAYWSAGDRTLAILAGYVYFFVLGALYLKKAAPITTSANGRRAEGIIADILRQAGGIIKVILIIGIEMIIFPLYCGLLLDMALLPLFERATFQSRLNFSLNSVWTSAFVHWFVGTCYMFHFALFVSMCRKIMRSGVLYFIRDPDDPTFHPVRDVLERSVTTQLRKITFSALVYGALVMVCLGGVVWGITYTVEGILPIHWSSNEPVLEFPVDLLFYNFLMPLAVRFFRPSDGLHKAYTWWFRKCARSLRLTWFLFGERQPLEEGYFPRTWTDLFNEAQSSIWGQTQQDRDMLTAENLERLNPNSSRSSSTEHGEVDDSELQHRLSELTTESESEVESTVDPNDLTIEVHPPEFVRNGRYVRAPGADQVRIPRGGPVFLDLLEDNARPEEQSHQDALFTVVYVPPHFKLRIALFVVAIWLFAAVTGVTLTILPLILGRRVFAILVPAPQRVNDLYAFSFGFCLLSSTFYGVKQAFGSLRSSLARNRALTSFKNPQKAISRLVSACTHALKVLYFYAMVTIVFPSLLALIIESYILIPLHAYLAPHETHVVHLAQGWTLGVLYLNLLLRVIKSRVFGRRPATALRSILRAGFLKPNVGLATRAFFLPGLAISAVILLAPLGLARIGLWLLLAGNSSSSVNDESTATVVMTSERREVLERQAAAACRFAYPAVAAAVGWAALGWGVAKALGRWSGRVRDEVYLVGERLHNFGERKGRIRKAGAAAAAGGTAGVRV